MHRLNRHRVGRTIATVAAVLAVALVVGWAAPGFDGGMLSAIAIGVGVAVAILSDGRTTCSPRMFRRRD